MCVRNFCTVGWYIGQHKIRVLCGVEAIVKTFAFFRYHRLRDLPCPALPYPALSLIQARGVDTRRPSAKSIILPALR